MKIKIEQAIPKTEKVCPKDFKQYTWYSDGARSILLYRASEAVAILITPSSLSIEHIGGLAHTPYDEVCVDEVTFKIKEISK